MDKKILIIAGIFAFILSTNLLLAVPQLTISSPQNITYDSTKVSLNITSNEVVDFFIKDLRGRKNTILIESALEFNEFLYVNEGQHIFEVWGNNSNGEAYEKVVYSVTAHNPINVTSCGTLTSSDTKYVLQNDISISDGTRYCLRIDSIRNVSVDLNGYSVENTFTSGYSRVVQTWYGSDVEIFNGTIKSPPGTFPYLIEPYGSKYYLHDLIFNGGTGFNTLSADDVVFENVAMNVTTGFWYYTTSTHFINSSIEWNGVVGGQVGPTAFYYQGDSSEIFLEETTISGFPTYEIYLEGTYTDFYLRNTDINYSKIFYPNFVSDLRVFDQHLILINVTDQFNETGSGVIEVKDNELFDTNGGSDPEGITDTLMNPTGNLLLSTNSNGTTDVWLTEKLTYAKSSSPVQVSSYDFSIYNLTARTWDTNATAVLNLTNVSSTIPIGFNIVVIREIPQCTITEMLDLNNDGTINNQDSLIVIRYITGKPISFNSTKECEGINLNPF